MWKKVVTTLGILLITGCAQNLDRLNPVASTLPALNFYYVPPSKTLLRQCQDAALPGDQCHANILPKAAYLHELQHKGQFAWVGEDEDTDYLLTLSTAGTEKTPWLVAEMVLSWRGMPIQSYQLRRQASYSKVPAEASSATLVERFLALAQKDAVFGASFLAQRLNSEDYNEDLQVPARVSAFELRDKVVYNDPLQGSMLTYQDPQYGEDRIEVSVYPIPTSDISDTPQVLHNEANKLRANLHGFVKRHQLPPLSMTENKLLRWQAKDKEFSGYYLDASIESSDKEPFYAAYFFFVREDKIVKFSTTFPASFAMDFVKEALPQMQVPQESVFLSKLRAMPD